MAPTIEIQGEWWLPEVPDRRIAGWLTYSRDSGGDLRLQGELRDRWTNEELPDGTTQRVWRVHRNDHLYPRIYGESQGRQITLEDCFRASGGGGWNPSPELIRVNSIFRGRLIHGDPAFERSMIAMKFLTSWVGASGLRRDVPADDPDPRTVALIKGSSLPSLASPIGVGLVALDHGLSTSLEDHAHTISEEWTLRLDPAIPLALDQHLELVSDVQDLVTLAVGRIAEIETLHLADPDLPLGRSAARANRGREIEFDTRWWIVSDEDDENLRPFFTFDEFGGVEAVAHWIDIAVTYRTELGRVMATRYSRTMFMEDAIMNVCAALESFDKIRRKNGKKRIHFVDRIEACAEFAGSTFDSLIVEPRNSWAKRVKRCRNDIAHHLARMRRNETDVDHLLSEQLFWLFALCMLNVVGAPDAVFNSIRGHRRIAHLREEAHALNQDP